MKESASYMSPELWMRIIDEIAPHNVTLVPFWRGESMMHPLFDDMIEYAISKVKSIQFATNGHLLWKHLPLVSNFDFVSISCHNEAGFEALKALQAFRKKTGKKQPRIQASFVESEKTAAFAGSALRYADIVRIYKEHSINGKLGSINDSMSAPRQFCQKLINDITITNTGDVSRCCHSWNSDAPLNIRSSTIADAWNSNHYAKIRDEYPDAICSDCDQWTGRTIGERLR